MTKIAQATGNRKRQRGGVLRHPGTDEGIGNANAASEPAEEHAADYHDQAILIQ